MSYYFCIVGTRDNPLYQADLAPKPAGSSGAASFFGVSSGTTSNVPTSQQQTQIGGGGGDLNASAEASTATSGGVFGFGNALGAITGGLGGASSRDAARQAGQTTATSNNGQGKGLGFGRYNDKHVLQMIAHSSLDVVEDKQFTNNLM